MDAEVLAQDAWFRHLGTKIGCTRSNGHERRTIRALIRKGAMEQGGQITDAGRASWNKRNERKAS